MYGNTARPWPQVVEHYVTFANANPALVGMATLVRRIAESGFPEAGLHAATSMFDLLLGPSPGVLDNPFLRVTYDIERTLFVLTYEPGGDRMATREPRWSRITAPEDVWPAIERFLMRRVRWYRRPVAPRRDAPDHSS